MSKSRRWLSYTWKCNSSNDDFSFLAKTFFSWILAHILVKVPRPGDSEWTFWVFESSDHLFIPV